MIDHGLGLYSLLAHLSKFAIKNGDRGRRGQVVGFVGATGCVTGPHLHWTILLNGARVDPRSLIALTNDSPLRLEMSRDDITPTLLRLTFRWLPRVFKNLGRGVF